MLMKVSGNLKKSCILLPFSYSDSIGIKSLEKFTFFWAMNFFSNS